MKIPKTVKIAGMVWKIKLDKPVTTTNSVYGCTVYDTQTIYINPDIPHQKKEQTLLHELMHAIFWHYGLTPILKEDIEEQIVNASTFGLYQVLKDNKLIK